MTKKKKGMSKGRKIAQTIILPIVAIILVVGIILANHYLTYYSLIINRFLAGDTVDTSSAGAQDALSAADLVVRESAEESIVLLENKDDYLPQKDLKKVNLFGWGSTDAGLLMAGGGSGGTIITDYLDNGTKRIKLDLTDAFTEAGIEYNTALTAAYENFSKFDADYRSNGTTGAHAEESLKNPGEWFYTDELLNEAYNYSHTAVAVLSRWGCENGGGNELKNIGTYNNGTFLELTAEERVMFDKLQAKGFDVIVLLNVCNNMELGFVKEYSSIKACLHMGIPGQSGTAAIPKILTGEVNPSGRTSDTLAYDYQTYNPVYLNATQNSKNLTYQEGIYFGYKWYETADAEGYFDGVSNDYGEKYDGVVQYPFGYGLSYTKFNWEVKWPGANVLNKDGEYTVEVTVTNTGTEAGKDVVQLYGHAPYTNGKIEKAERVLLDFAKTPLIAAGDSATVELHFTAYDLASYDEYDKNGNNFKGYELEAGTYEILVMKNAHESFASKEMTRSSDIRYSEDPVTGKKVENRFTGNTAYANCPVDGSTVDHNVNYLSRKDCFANMPTQAAGAANASKVNSAASYRYQGYNNADVSNIQYGTSQSFFLVGYKQEGMSLRPATLAMLNGTDTSVTLGYNKDIINLLLDFEDEANDIYWDILLDQLTQDEVKALIGQAGFQTIEVASIGKPRCTDKDGPAGFNNNVVNVGKASPYTLFPSESLLGCSWSKETAYAIGEAQAKLGNAMGINGWYGPGVNLHRSVYNSRNYEYYSEDAVLSGKLAAFTITGAKDNNLYCYLKHFAVSEAGENPKDWNVWLTEQALRENYLRPFEIAVKEGGANAIMSAFNRVGATLSGYNHALLTDVLREEWGFKGSVITDWFMGSGSGYMDNHELGVLAGNDLWLCGTSAQSAKIDLNKPEIAYAARQSVKNILYTYLDTNATADSITVNAEAQSSLFAALKILLYTVLGLGIAACVIFTALPWVLDIFRKKKGNAAVAASDGSTVTADPTDGVSIADFAVQDPYAEEPPAEAVEDNIAVEEPKADEVSISDFAVQKVEEPAKEEVAPQEEAVAEKPTPVKKTSTSTAKKSTSTAKKTTSSGSKSGTTAKKTTSSGSKSGTTAKKSSTSSTAKKTSSTASKTGTTAKKSTSSTAKKTSSSGKTGTTAKKSGTSSTAKPRSTKKTD